jgi:hypothetical protein
MRWTTAEWLAGRGAARRLHAVRWIWIAAGLAGLIAGCGGAAPLVTESQQAGMSSCVPSPSVGAGIGPVANFVKQHPNVYEIGVDVSARKPGAAWADGVDVGYVANGHSEVIRLYIGLGIGAGPRPRSANDDDPLCDKAMSAIQAAFQSLPGG